MMNAFRIITIIWLLLISIAVISNSSNINKTAGILLMDAKNLTSVQENVENLTDVFGRFLTSFEDIVTIVGTNRKNINTNLDFTERLIKNQDKLADIIKSIQEFYEEQ